MTLNNISLSIPNPNKILKANHNLLFSSSASSFPCNLKLPSLTASVPTHLHPLSDSTDESFVKNLEGFEFSDQITNGLPNLQSNGFYQIPNGLANLQKILNGSREIPNGESVRTRRIFIEDPAWIPYSLIKDLDKKAKKVAKSEAQEVGRKKYNLLMRRQIKAETEAWQKMVEEYREIEREMCENKLGHHLPFVKKLFLGWFEPLRAAIAKEQRVLQSKNRKTALMPFMDMLTADKMAVIAMHKMMATVMGAHGREDRAVPVTYAALQIGAAIEQEVRIHGFLEKTKSQKTVAPTEEGFCKDAETLRKRLKSLIKKQKIRAVQKLVEDEEIKPWGRDIQAKLGSRLIQLLIETAYVQAPVDQSADSPPDIHPAFSHTFIRLSPWKKNSQRSGVILPDPLLLAGLHGTARHTVIPYMPMLVPPKKWKRYDKGGYFFLPSYLMRTHGSRPQQDAVKNTAADQMQKIYEALDTLGNTKWRINKRVLSVMERIWAGGGNTGGLVDRKDVPIPERPESEDDTEIKKWKWSVRGAKRVNRELHGQRCDTELKLSVARQMKDEDGFYYPHNIDFRGRAYPMHSHLNHLNSDICRGVLEFAEGRPLGNSGLRWLKIHLANLYGDGVEKLSYEGRLAFVENHLENIRDSADNPLHGNQWWLTAEDPFQCLAACINLSEALTSSAPHNVISHLPIHQDGSCNGLQHYAALGRDSFGAVAVNLVAGEKPADVYSEIAARVHDIMKRDSNKDPATNPNAILAKALIGQVDRKLVKQTVMTSVYGVTFVGARQQIKRKLQEKGQITDDTLLFKASCYAAKVTMAALEELFDAARGIMGWLGYCAKVIASQNQPVRWTTPIGLPIVQPYFKPKMLQIKTSLQVLSLKQDGTTVEIKKQRTAFPPNFVHSLDGSHMMMTAVACRDAGLCFAGVHDSFWTHACDVDRMNRILREKFVELYSIPILENLLESFQKAYPELTFPPLPERGDFDLQEVIDSPYFFN
ncbi:hypothetical protein Vadar_033230 [Vaccinium darrowii]|uniref:Uncharacterized protein n=1 Tax=Vaccinium darrowii TaxID=229202 RepID=A0ACB7Z952_9ERIC|nr:hypothetical protein Vadar_033230 [Vaccinium darrowii]